MAKERKGYPSDVSDEEWAPLRAVSGVDEGGRPAADAQLAGGLQRAAVSGAGGLRRADAAQRPAAVAGSAAAGAALAAAAQGSKLEVIKLAHAKRGFVLRPRRWVVERSFGWAVRFRRLARDYERLASSLAGLHWLAFVCLMLRNLFA